MPEPKGTPGQHERARALVDLLTRECGELTEAEGRLAWAVALGDECDLLRDGDTWLMIFTLQDAWHDWGEHRTIRAGVIRAICVREDAHSLVDRRGVQLSNARITGGLDLDGTHIPFDLWLIGCAFDKPIVARGATVCTLSLQGSRVPGLSADRLVATGDIFLRDNFYATGKVQLSGAHLGGSLSCKGGRFEYTETDPSANPFGITKKEAFIADRLVTVGDVGLNAHFYASGEVGLRGARVGGNLDCVEGVFDNSEGIAFDATGAEITRTLLLRNSRFQGELHLTRSRVGSLNDAQLEEGYWVAVWPERILLTDCRYDAIHTGAPLDAKSRLAWLANHDRTLKEFREKGTPPDPGPYRWLATILRKQGHEADADKVMTWLGWRRLLPLFKHRLGGTAWDKFVAVPYLVASFLYGIVVGHGYARFLPLAWLVVFFALGWCIFSHNGGRHMQPTQGYVLRAWTQAEQAGWAANPKRPWTINEWIDASAAPRREAGVVYAKPTPEEIKAAEEAQLTDQQLRWIASYPKFSPWVYSLDAFLPLVDFHQEDYWTPSSGWWAKDWYLPFHIAAGWIIATLFAASFTRLARQD